MKLKKYSLLAVAVAAAALAGIATTGSSGASSGATTIRYEQFSGLVYPVELASYLGYLPGIKLESVGTVLGGPADIQSVATGNSDIGGAFNGSIVKLIAAGAPIKAVVGYYGSNSQTYEGLYVPAGSRVKTARDLIGKTVGVNTLGANEQEVVDLWLAKQGLTRAQIAKVEFVVVPPVDAALSLKEGKLASAVLSFSFVRAAEHATPLRQLVTDTSLIGPYTGGSLVLRNSFIQQHPAVSKQLVAGIAKAVVWLQRTPAAKVIAIADKVALAHGRTTDPSILKYWKSTGIAETGGFIRPIDFTPWIKALEDTNQLKPSRAIALSQIYTNQFNPYASK